MGGGQKSEKMGEKKGMRERERGGKREREGGGERESTLMYIIPVCIHVSQKLKATRYL